MDNLVDIGDTQYYELVLCSTGQVVAVPVNYSVELVSGIWQREVNKAKGV